MGRLSFVNDLHAEDAVYHHQCIINFRTGRGVPQRFDFNGTQHEKNPKIAPGRPTEVERHEAFIYIIEYLEENQDE
jgi:hypothetical protein